MFRNGFSKRLQDFLSIVLKVTINLGYVIVFNDPKGTVGLLDEASIVTDEDDSWCKRWRQSSNIPYTLN